ncbi:MAG: non-ribosomal peptide synthetase [Chitinophagaceae bacterium]
MLTASEEHQLLVEFNHTASEYPKDKTIVDLFEEQAARTPAATALVFKEKELTYNELNEKANQFGHYLRSKGIMEEILVPICIERSLEMIIGILGILKAGAAYVPIEPDYPLDRINFMLEDIRATIVVSSQQSSSKLQTSATIEQIQIDPDLRVVNTQPIENLQVAIQPHHLAYIIYTSGSTGKPKGVMIEHTSIVNYLLNSKTKYIGEKQGGSGSFIHLSYTFDASLTAMFMPLLSGKKVIIGSQQALLIFEDSNLWKYAPYDFIKITPSHLELLSPILENENGNLLTSKLVIGGEALRLSQFDYLVEKGIDVEVINEYGPTEATVGCSTYHFNTLGDNEKLKNNISIGKPIDNLQLYILNSQNQLLPVGVMGELCIGGHGVARGYLNRTDLTDQKFIQNPFSTTPGSRIYKTGDLCRWNANGNLEYLGRKDDQVKIKGYRIELGEIESALNQHPGLQQVVVMARGDSPNNKSLVAYLIPKEGQMPVINDVRHFLSKTLPEYMLPSMFIFMESLPLTSNGKIDRSALPAPDKQRRELSNTFVAAGNALELRLKKIYEESLNIHSIGIHDNFFDLGGDSMHAAQIFSKIRKTFGKQLPLAILFQAPTIKQLASYIENEVLIAPWSSLVPIQPNGTKPPLFCMHAGAGTVLFYKSLSLHLGQDQPMYGLQAKGLNGNETPHSRIEAMAAHYINEVRTVQPEGPYLLGGYCFGGILAFEMAQQIVSQKQKVAVIINFNGVSPTYTQSLNLPVVEEENDFEGDSALLLNRENEYKKEISLSIKRKIFNLLKKLISYKLRLKIKKLVYNFYIFRNRPLPEALGNLYFWETNADIVRRYKPKPYPGKMIIFRSPGIYSDPHLGWDGLVTGGIETFDIPGKHRNRREIMNEPFIQDTAERLKLILEGETIQSI